MCLNCGSTINMYFNNEELNCLRGISDIYIKALAIIGRVYAERLDKSGNAELGHFIRVSDHFDTLDEKVAGLLHDIVEDKLITFEDLIKVGIPEHIVDVLKILARDKAIYPNYEDYVTAVIESNNEIAIRVKYADMSDNSSEKRLCLLDEPERMRLVNKYIKQLPRLEKKIKELNGYLILERKCV